MMPNIRRERLSYEVKQITLTDQFIAVFAVQKQFDDPHYDLESMPLHAIGVAEVTRRFFEDQPFPYQPREYRDAEKYTDIVGLYLEDGCWQIANECSNYTGMTFKGGDIRLADAYLTSAMGSIRLNNTP